MKKYTTESFKKRIKELYGDTIILDKVQDIENKKRNDLVTLICPKHGEYTKTINSLLKRQGKCDKCRYNWLTLEEFFEKFNSVYTEEERENYSFNKLELKGNKDTIIVTCNKHGDFPTTPYVFLNHHGCKRCSVEKIMQDRKITVEEFIKRSKENHKDENGEPLYDYSKVKELNSLDDIIEIGCKRHGWVKQKASNHLYGCGCIKCAWDKWSKKRTKSHEQYVLDCEKVHGKGRYIYLNKYTGKNNPIIFQCTKCGRITTISANSHLNNKSGCSFCIKSKLERNIQVFLENNNIKFIPQFPIINRQSLDFYLDDYNLAIECQGSQHFSNNHFKEGLDILIKRDVRKYNYCRENGIKLIYYTEPKLLTSDLINNKKFGNIYQSDNIFSNLDELLSKIKSMPI